MDGVTRFQTSPAGQDGAHAVAGGGGDLSIEFDHSDQREVIEHGAKCLLHLVTEMSVLFLSG